MKEAYLLWLYYDYVTEMFDRNLPHKISGRGGEARVRGDYVSYSNSHAKTVMNFISKVATFSCIGQDVMETERRKRMSQHIESRIREYEYITNNVAYLYDFVGQYEEYERMVNEHLQLQNKAWWEKNRKIFNTDGLED